MEPLCKDCKYVKVYCTGNRDMVHGLFAFKLQEFDLPGEELFISYACRITNEDVEDPFNCDYYESWVDERFNDAV